MGVGEDFQAFCSNLVVSKRDSIAERSGRITKRLNIEFWATDSSTSHSFYLGSYGRGTAIGGTSDVDMLFQLPYAAYQKYDAYATNGQSALLQQVRAAVRNSYVHTDVGADGQVVTVPFDDGITFELLRALFLNTDGGYTFPDANEGGSLLRLHQSRLSRISGESKREADILVVTRCKPVRVENREL